MFDEIDEFFADLLSATTETVDDVLDTFDESLD